MAEFLNLVRQTTATTGTGTVTLGAVVSGFVTMATAGAVNGVTYSYAIETNFDGSGVAQAREVGTGVYSTTGPTLTRVLENSTTGALLNLAGTSHVIITPTKVTLRDGAYGQCRLVKSGTDLLLQRVNGTRITINGVSETIPSAGVTLSATGQTIDATRYIYAYMSAGTMTLEASATAYATDTTTGVVIKSGDATRTLVGMARAITGPAWVDTARQRLVRSWFNQSGMSTYAYFGGSRTTTSATAVEINTEIRNETLLWTGETWNIDWAGAVTISGSTGLLFVWALINGTASATDDVAVIVSVYAAGEYLPSSGGAARSGLAEGFHYVTIFGSVNAGTGVWRNADGERYILKARAA